MNEVDERRSDYDTDLAESQNSFPFESVADSVFS